MRKFMLLVLLLIGTNPLYVQSSNRVQARPSPVTRLLKIDGKYQPVRGMNLAWLNGCYGHDFGGHPAHRDWETGATYDSATVISVVPTPLWMTLNSNLLQPDAS